MRVCTLDIGGTSIKSALIENGSIIQRHETATNARHGGESVMLTCEKVIAEYQDFDRIGISTAGQVDYTTGVILYANENIPQYTGMQVSNRFKDFFGVPVVVENDVNCAALGEAVFGIEKIYGNFLCLTYGTGIGGAIIKGKRVYHGAGCGAAEFGHIVTHANGRQCACGQKGCYEQYASTTALIRNACEIDATLTSGRDIFLRIAEPAIQQVVEKWCDEIIFGLSSLVHCFDPPLIVLGGGIMNEAYIYKYLVHNLYKNIMPNYQNVQLRQAQLGNSAGLLGAYHLATLL